MEVTGTWGQEQERLLQDLLVPCGNIESQLRCLRDGPVKEGAMHLYNDLSAVSGHLINSARSTQKIPSQVAAVLVRTLIDCCCSVFAFCVDPQSRGTLYLNYRAVLDLRLGLANLRHVGCPFVPANLEIVSANKARVSEAGSALRSSGSGYLRKRCSSAGQARRILEGALAPGAEDPRPFRETWYPEGRRGILEEEGMGWLYDVVYKLLCSAVHSDPAASMILRGFSRRDLFTVTLEFWGAGMYKLVEAFRINLPSEHKALLRLCYKHFLWPVDDIYRADIERGRKTTEDETPGQDLGETT